MSSTRNEILNILCDTKIFPKGTKMYSPDIIDKISKIIDQYYIKNVKDFGNSVRQALETISGYNFSDGTTCSISRVVVKKKISSTSNSHGYIIEYTFQ